MMSLSLRAQDPTFYALSSVLDSKTLTIWCLGPLGCGFRGLGSNRA